MTLRARTKFENPGKPAINAGITLFCARDSLSGDWVRCILAEKDVDGARIEWITPGKPHHDLLVLNPEQTLPTLADRDVVMYSAPVIANYLDERYPHPPLLPQEPALRAHLRMALARLETELFPLADSITHASARDAQKARKQLADLITQSSRLFPTRGWFLGLEFNLADCAWAALLQRAAALNLQLPPSADPVRRYAQRLFARPALRNALK